MKPGALIAAVVTALVCSFSLPALSAPARINYQGRITDASGVPINGNTVSMTFYIYPSATGTTALWSETHTAVTVEQGLYSVELGKFNPLDASVFSGDAWLEVVVGTETLTPRRQLTTVPYAFSAETMAGDNYVLTSGDTITGNLELDGTLLIRPASGNSVGILFSTTLAPEYGILATGKQLGIYGAQTGGSVMNIGALGMSTNGVYGSAGSTVLSATFTGGSFGASSAGTAVGVSASATSTGADPARGVMAFSTNSGSGEVVGGYFVAMSGGSGTHTGVYGRSLAGDSVNYGVMGEVASPDGYGLYSKGNAFVEGAIGVDGIAQDKRTKKQIAALHWYGANQNTAISLTSGGLYAAAYNGANSMGITQIAGGDRLYAVGLDLNNQSSVVLSGGPSGVAYDGRYFWTAQNASNRVYRETGEYVTVGSNPRGICFDGRYLWVANGNSDDVSVVDPVSQSLVTTLSAGVSPFWTVCTEDHVWVTNSGDGAVIKYNKQTFAVEGTYYIVEGPPQGAAYDGSNIWIACDMDDVVIKMRESDGTRLGVYATGDNPNGVVFDGSHVWVTNHDSNSISKFRAIDGADMGTFSTCTGPRMPAFDGVHIWVPCDDGSVSKM